MPKFIDLTGKTFGRLTVIERVDRPEGSKSKKICWLCECECGNNKVVVGDHLRSGNTRSCGCLLSEVASKTHTKHGHNRSSKNKTTSTYSIWGSMIQRCCNPNSSHYFK